MQGRKTPLRVTLIETERGELKRWQRCTTIPSGPARRAKCVLLVAEGKGLTEAGREVGFTRKIVRRWVSRFIKKRVQGLYDKEGRGRKPFFSPGSRYSPG